MLNAILIELNKTLQIGLQVVDNSQQQDTFFSVMNVIRYIHKIETR
jgi:hypothetical protein